MGARHERNRGVLASGSPLDDYRQYSGVSWAAAWDEFVALADHLAADPDADLTDVAYTLALGRSRLPCRAAVVAAALAGADQSYLLGQRAVQPSSCQLPGEVLPAVGGVAEAEAADHLVADIQGQGILFFKYKGVGFNFEDGLLFGIHDMCLQVTVINERLDFNTTVFRILLM